MQQHRFMSGLMGGFIGYGLAGMVFGPSGYAADGSGFGSMLGLLLQFAVIAGLIWLAISFFRRRSGLATAPGMLPSSAGAMAAPTAGAVRDPVEIPIIEADFNARSGVLTGVPASRAEGPLAEPRPFVAPEQQS